MPVITGILTGLAVAAAGAGVGSSVAASGAASKGQEEQNAIAQQEQNNRNQAFQQAESFYTPYTKSGSPFLAQTQAAGAGQNAQQYNQAAGQLRQTMQTSGLGYGNSGSTAAVLGQLGQGEAQNSASTYLSNLLNNEAVKFKAQQGITDAANGPQLTPNSQVIPTTTGSSVNAFGQAVNNLTQPKATPPVGVNPNSAQNFNVDPVSQFFAPSTQGVDA